MEQNCLDRHEGGPVDRSEQEENEGASPEFTYRPKRAVAITYTVHNPLFCVFPSIFLVGNRAGCRFLGEKLGTSSVGQGFLGFSIELKTIDWSRRCASRRR